MAYGDMFEDIAIVISFWRGGKSQDQKWLPNWNVAVYYIIQETLRLHYWCMHCRHADALSVYSPNFEIKKLDSHPKKTLNPGYNPYIHGICTY